MCSANLLNRIAHIALRNHTNDAWDVFGPLGCRRTHSRLSRTPCSVQKTFPVRRFSWSRFSIVIFGSISICESPQITRRGTTAESDTCILRCVRPCLLFCFRPCFRPCVLPCFRPCVRARLPAIVPAMCPVCFLMRFFVWLPVIRLYHKVMTLYHKVVILYYKVNTL